MKTVLGIVYHNRRKNLDYWLSIIPQMDKTEVSFNLIHNCEIPSAEIRARVTAVGARYIPRANVGMDIGALQDVARRRLKGFDYDYDFLLWFTDDCLPMRPDMVARYLEPFTRDPETGVSCLEISTQIKRHIRTTGFCIRREFAERLTFPADPIKTKEECYRFEHRDKLSLLGQVMADGKKAVQISDLRHSPAWDSGGGGHGWINRKQEFERQWGIGVTGSKVAVLAPAFLRYPMIAPSMLAQTYHNWELFLAHDGPAPNDFPRFEDPRIRFTEEQGPRKNYGHPIREKFLQKIKAKQIEADYVVISNDDNYHAPFFLEKLVKQLDEHAGAPGVYCSGMVHNYAGFPGQVPKPGKQNVEDGYNIIQVKPERGFIDVAAAMIRAPLAGAAGWPDYSHSSDWTYLNRVAQQNGGWTKWRIAPGVLLTHN